MKELILLVDGENLLHRSFHKFENLKSSEGESSGAIFGFFKSLHSMVTRFQPTTLIITFDNGKSPLRLAILPEYKAHRKNISIDYESLQKQKKIIQRMLFTLRIPYIFDRKNCTPYEGDDLLAWYAIRNSDQGLHSIIVSSDKDFNQLIDEKTSIYNPSKDERINLKNCNKIVGYNPRETVDFLCMVGDTSDDIPGFPGIGPVKARQILDQFGSLEKAFKEIQLGKELKYFKDPKSLYEIWARNRMLIDLRAFIKANPLKNHHLGKILHYSLKPTDFHGYMRYCKRYSLNSLITNIFIEAFKFTTYPQQTHVPIQN